MSLNEKYRKFKALRDIYERAGNKKVSRYLSKKLARMEAEIHNNALYGRNDQKRTEDSPKD